MFSSHALSRFLASTVMDADKWRDGEPYDLDALDELTLRELGAVLDRIEAGTDWRDVDAIAAIAERATKLADRATTALNRHAAQNPSPAHRLRATEHLQRIVPQHAAANDDGGDPIATAIDATSADGEMSHVLDAAARNPSDAVKRALLRAARDKPGTLAVHAAALLYYLAGRAAEPFDWNHRPFFLRFNPKNDADGADHGTAFAELCATLNVDPTTL